MSYNWDSDSTKQMLIDNLKCEVISFDFTTNTDYNTVLRVKIDPEKDGFSNPCSKWIDSFSKLTKSQWIVARTKPNLQKYVYRKDFACQHSKKNKALKKDDDKRRNRNKECCARIIITIKKNNKNARKKDPLMLRGLNGLVKIQFHHTHQIHNAETYSYLRVSKEVRDEFMSYFNAGMTPAEAKAFHEVNLIKRSGDINIIKIQADAQINPTGRQVYQLHNLWRASDYGDKTELDIFKILKEKRNKLQKTGVTIELLEDPLCILVITPLMRRAHSFALSQDVVFVDSNGTCDRGASYVTFFFGCSKIGAIPLGVMIHKFLTVEDFKRAFKLLKDTLGDVGFNGKGFPSEFMIADCAAEREALKAVFPESKIVLSPFSVSQALWRWLWNAKNSISKQDRRSLMIRFKGILYLFEPDKTEQLMTDLCQDEQLLIFYPNFIEQVKALQQRMGEWCVSYNQNCFNRDDSVRNVVESSVRIFKDLVLERCKAFNSSSLVDFLCNVLESYHKRRLTKYSGKRITRLELNFRRYFKKAEKLTVIPLSEAMFYVGSSTEIEHLHSVSIMDKNLEFCDCPEGQEAKFCLHICAVYLKGHVSQTLPFIANEDKEQFVKIATGNTKQETPSQNDAKNDSSIREEKQEAVPEAYADNMDTYEEAANSSVAGSVHSPPPADDHHDNDNDGSNNSLLWGMKMKFDEPKPAEAEAPPPKKPEFKRKIVDELEHLQNNIDRIKSITRKSDSKAAFTHLKKFNKQLQSIRTVADFTEFCGSLNEKKVKPTKKQSTSSSVVKSLKKEVD